MKAARSIVLSAVSLIALAALVPACSGGGDDDDDDDAATTAVTPLPDPTPIPGSVAEVEPNGTMATATAVAGSGATLAFHGTCAQTGDQDYFAFTLSSGGISGELTWDERAYIPAPHILNDLDVYVTDSSGEIGQDSSSPPDDSPAQFVATVTSAGAVYVFVECFQADEDLFYQGTLAP